MIREVVVLPEPNQNAVFQDWEGIGSICLIRWLVRRREISGAQRNHNITCLISRTKRIQAEKELGFSQLGQGALICFISSRVIKDPSKIVSLKDFEYSRKKVVQIFRPRSLDGLA